MYTLLPYAPLGSDDKQRVFGTLDVRCHVQQCLIRAIDHIIFTSVGSKHQDQRLFYAAAKEVSTIYKSSLDIFFVKCQCTVTMISMLVPGTIMQRSV